MKVTIEGDLDQVAETLSLDRSQKTPRQIRLKENAEARRIFVERRERVLAAFKAVRNSPADSEVAAKLLIALRRTTGVTDDDLEIARRVLSPGDPQ